jgi:hypothetical protein
MGDAGLVTAHAPPCLQSLLIKPFMDDLERAPPTSFARFMLGQHCTRGSQGCMFQDPTLVLKDIAFVPK